MNNVLKITLWGYDVGRLVWDDKERRAFFSFSPSFLSTGYDIAPMTASISKPYLRQGGIYKGNIQQKIYKGLPEFLADSLPGKLGIGMNSEMFSSKTVGSYDNNSYLCQLKTTHIY